MAVTQTTRQQLLLSRNLLANAQYQGAVPNDAYMAAHDVILAHAAAELALAVICGQLGLMPSNARQSLADYSDWLRALVHSRAVESSLDYLTRLHSARTGLQYRRPDRARWDGVREVTFEHLAALTQQYLGLDFRSPDSSSEDGVPPEQPLPTAQTELAQAEDQRTSPRYSCIGEAEVRIPYAGPVSKGQIANLSLGGCYIEMEAPFDLSRRVEIVLRVNRLSFRARGQVIYSQPFRAGAGRPAQHENAGMGVEFTGMSAGGRQRLQELIEELEACRTWAAKA